MSRASVLAAACLFLSLSPVAVRAQVTASPSVQFSVETAPTSRLDHSMVGSARLGVSVPSAAVTTPDALAAMRADGLRHRGPGVALMIVGAAGIITGLLVDEGLVTIAGAGVGLYGLYLYLR